MPMLGPEDVTYEQVAKMIDHSLLRPELTLTDVEKGCELAARLSRRFGMCPSADVALAAELSRSSEVEVGTVVGFPHGSHTTATKVFEAERALADGATELDMVINIGWLRSGEDRRVEDEIRAVVAAAGEGVGEGHSRELLPDR